MPRVSDLVRAAGWRQGSIARPADTRALLEERFSSILDDCPGVNVADDDMHTLPEDDLTLADFRRFRRLDKDYRSLPERAGVEQPAEGDGGL